MAAVLTLVTLLDGMHVVYASADCPNISHDPNKDYSGKDLTNANFSNQDLANANFTNAVLNGASFKGANLKGADFTGARLGISADKQRRASFTQADVSGACFLGAAINEAEFEFANVSCSVFAATNISNSTFGPLIKAADPGGQCRTSFAGTTMNCEFIPQWKDLDLTNARVQNCYDKLKGRDFSRGWMRQVIFSGLDLEDTVWTGADLREAFFLSANLKNAVFDGANLRQAQLSQARAAGSKFRNQAQLSGAFLSGIELTGADMSGAVLAAADNLQPADLTFAYMPNAVLTDAQMTGVNLSHADFYGANGKADKATMQQINLTDANLGSVNLAQGQLVGARLDGANLVNANLAGANLQTTSTLIPASLVKASLQGADLTQTKLQGANLSNAAVALQDGVPLFGLDDGLAQDLDKRWLTAELANGFLSQGYVLLSCENPSIKPITPAASWELWLNNPVGGDGKTKYKRFLLEKDQKGIAVSGITAAAGSGAPLFTVTGDFGNDLDAQLLPRALIQAFKDNDYVLPPCSNPVISVQQANSKWGIAVTLNSISSVVLGIGYTGYTLLKETQTNPSEIRVFGSQITVVRPDDKGVLTLVPIPVQPTKIAKDSFDDNTTMPNQKSYGANKRENASWEAIMTAATPPPPPLCIPSPYQWCPPDTK